MKKIFTLALLVSLSLASCSKEKMTEGEVAEKGRIAIDLGFDTMVEATRSELAYESDCTRPAAEDFKLVVEGLSFDYDPEYSYREEFNSITELEGLYLYRGFYGVSASYGDVTVEGYDKPAFVGVNERFEVEARKNVTVSVTATIANALVLVEVTENFEKYFAGGHSFNVVTAADNTFENVTAGDKAGKPIFIAPASFTVVGTATKQPNQSGANAVVVNMTDTFENVAPRTLYRVKMDVDTAGEATLKVTLNDSLVEERNIEQELNPWA